MTLCSSPQGKIYLWSFKVKGNHYLSRFMANNKHVLVQQGNRAANWLLLPQFLNRACKRKPNIYKNVCHFVKPTIINNELYIS